MNIIQQIKASILKGLCISILFFFFINKLYCQEIKTTRDVGIWSGVGIDYKLNNKWMTSFTQEFRSFDEAIKLQKSITELGLTYKINKQFKLATGIRYTYGKKDYVFTHGVRYNIDFKFKRKLTKNLNLHYRFRYQNCYAEPINHQDELEINSKARNAIKMQYELKKHSPYFTMEIFREYLLYKRPSFNNLRVSVGDKLKTQKGNFNYGFVYERELNNEYPLNFFVLKLNYTICLKHD